MILEFEYDNGNLDKLEAIELVRGIPITEMESAFKDPNGYTLTTIMIMKHLKIDSSRLA